MLGLRVLSHCVLPTHKLQENSLAADEQWWKSILGFVPGHEQRSGLLIGFSSTLARRLQWQGAFVSISRLLRFLLGVEPCTHSILSSHTSLPLLDDPSRQEQNLGNVSYVELQLWDTCSDNQHRAKPPTLCLVWAAASDPTLTSAASIHTQTHYTTVRVKIKKQASVSVQPWILSGGKLKQPLTPCILPPIISEESVKQGQSEAITDLSCCYATDLININQRL